ncbi:unnamed protein product, partial [Brassica oleracea var. botrytis]
VFSAVQTTRVRTTAIGMRTTPTRMWTTPQGAGRQVHHHQAHATRLATWSTTSWLHATRMPSGGPSGPPPPGCMRPGWPQQQGGAGNSETPDPPKPPQNPSDPHKPREVKPLTDLNSPPGLDDGSSVVKPPTGPVPGSGNNEVKPPTGPNPGAESDPPLY